MKQKLSPFEKIKNGSKTIVLRLFDEKRHKVQVGDFIEFTFLDDAKQKIQTKVTTLHRFASFAELYATLPKDKLGYSLVDTPDSTHMDEYYSREDAFPCCIYDTVLYERYILSTTMYIDKMLAAMV